MDNTAFIFHPLSLAICIFYLSNIIPIIILRNKIFSSLMYINCIILCIAFSILTMYIGDNAGRNKNNCLIMLWSIFSVGSIMGSNYTVKCSRIVIQAEWNYYYSRMLKISKNSSTSNFTLSDSGEEESKLTRFILRAIPLLRERNSLILFFFLNLVGLAIPIIITLTNEKYMTEPDAICTMPDLVSLILIIILLLFYTTIVVISFIILLRRRKASENMYVVTYLKYIAISWFISIGVLIVVSIIAENLEEDTLAKDTMVMLTALIVVPPFIAEIILPQVKHLRDKRHLKRYESMRDEIESIEELMSVTFSKTLKVDIELEEDYTTVNKKNYVKNVNDCLRFFILDHKQFQSDFRSEGITTSILLEKLHFINMVNRSINEGVLSPGHVYKIWKTFFSPVETPSFKDIEIRIPDELKNDKLKKYFTGKMSRKETATREEWIEYFLDNVEWVKLYRADNPIGILGEEFVKDMTRMENDSLDDELAYERCSYALLEVYIENLDILNRLVLEPFKDSGYFHVMIESMRRMK